MIQSTQYQSTYKISSPRIRDYDYAQNGAYFVTICTQNKKKFFGDIVNEVVSFSQPGKIACDLWKKLPEQFTDLTLGEWIFMPNHMHGIIILDSLCPAVSQKNNVAYQGGITQGYNPMLHHNLSSIIRQFKARTTFEIRKNLPAFAWQARFYEHVVRNQVDFDRVSQYIIENPIAWEHDEYFR